MSSDERVPKPDNVNYKSVQMHNGKYRLRKVPLNNVTGSTVALSATATSLIEWKIPANTVFNPARSTIDYQTELAIPGAAGRFNYAFADTFEICQSIQFCDASGMYLTDLQFANNYVSTARKLDTDLDDFLTQDITEGLARTEGAPSANIFPPTAALPVNNVYTGAAATSLTSLDADDARYAVIGADNLATVVARSVPLSCFTGTALGMDRDMIFPQDMYIRIQVAPSNKVGFYATSATNASTGAAPLATQPVISNLFLQLATQVDPVLEASVRAKFLAGGMSFLIPYVYGWRNSTAAGTASIQIQLNNQYGKLLKRLLHVPFAASEALNVAYDHQNMNGAKIIQYQTFLDSQPLQDSQLSCLQPVSGGARGMDDWREHRGLVRGSTLTGSGAYYLNWFHCDSFSSPKRGKVLLPESNILEGLDLSMPRSWTITANTVGALTHYTFGTFVREVVSSPAGLQINVA
jgi:hypothetical protein